jgi:hypothetical protein
MARSCGSRLRVGFTCDQAGLTGIVDLDGSKVSRRFVAAKQNLEIDSKLAFGKSLVKEKYRARIAGLML